MTQEQEIEVFDAVVRQAMLEGDKPDEARRRANRLLSVMSTETDYVWTAWCGKKHQEKDQ